MITTALQTAAQVATNPVALVRSLLVKDDIPLEEQQTIGSGEDVEREEEEEEVKEETTEEQMETVLSGSNFSLSQLEDRGWIFSSDTPTSLVIKGFEGYLPEA